MHTLSEQVRNAASGAACNSCTLRQTLALELLVAITASKMMPASPLHANRSAALDMMQLDLVCFGHCSARQVSVPA